MRDIIAILAHIEGLVARLESDKVSAIERDIVLDKLKNIYSTLLEVEPLAEPETLLELIYDEKIVPAEEPVVAPEPEPEVVPIVTAEVVAAVAMAEAVEEAVAEPEEESAPEVEPEVVPEVEPEEEPEAEKDDIDDFVLASRQIDHKRILSLYDDEPAPAPAPQPVVEEEPAQSAVIDMTEIELEEAEDVPVAEVAAEESEEVDEPLAEDDPKAVTIGDVVAPAATLADQITSPVTDVATAAHSRKSLVDSIGLNDKYIILRDLFGGDHDYYEAAIDQIDSYDSLDEAMLFIYDNFEWDAEAEGTKILMELLTRKLL